MSWILAKGHLAALDYLSRTDQGEFLAINLGTGRGYSVLEMISAFERASGRPVPYKVIDRRPGDVASCYADPSLAEELLGWKAELDIDAMCADTWNWQSRNPDGYRAG
ncbi:UDP-glucose 4-epimerase OS=Stutzerimonas stutzeri OX=316 GN=CH92_00375 PE=3 SV=1 [Stutzerimonas stutzeri]